jgi:hypothetical protein
MRIPLTRPELFTVATVVLLLFQIPPGVGSSRSVVLPGQTNELPKILATLGAAFTVIVFVAEMGPHPVLMV